MMESRPRSGPSAQDWLHHAAVPAPTRIWPWACAWGVLPPPEDTAKPLCWQSTGRGREGRESGLTSSLPPSSLSCFKSLPHITFSSGMRALRSRTTSLAQG